MEINMPSEGKNNFIRACLEKISPCRLSQYKNVYSTNIHLLSVPASYPVVVFTWSLAVHHQSLAFRARLYHAKKEPPEEEAVSFNVIVFTYIRNFVHTLGWSKTISQGGFPQLVEKIQVVHRK